MSTTKDSPPKKKFDVLNKQDEDELDILPDEYEAYNIERQPRSCFALLDFCLSNGDHQAIAYNHLYDITFNRSEGLVLTFSEHVVQIKGRRLEDLYRQLKRHRVIWVWEAGPQEDKLANAKDSVITKITITERFPQS